MKRNKKNRKKEICKKIDNIWNILKDFFIKYKYVFIIALPFVLMELFMLAITHNISYVNYKIYGPLLFTCDWILLFVGLTLGLKNKIGKPLYIFFCLLFVLMFLVDGVYYSITNTFFDFYQVESASEGAPYFFEALKNCNPLVYISIIITIMAMIYGLRNIPNKEENDLEILRWVLCIFISIHVLTPYTLGRGNQELTWSSWRNARNIYETYNDNNKSLKVSGFYEYTVRNFYITFLKPEEKITEEDVDFLNSSFAKNEQEHKNSHTGTYKGKNLIIVQLEGMDSWLLNKSDTPTLYNMLNNSINFTNHYSYYNGGGSTFNSEFVVNTGFITPLSYTKNAYTFNRNNFPYTLAKLFKEQNYSVNAFHMNTGEYYSRAVNYKNWGYDNYYGLIETGDYSDKSYQLDRELILNEKFESLMFPEEGNFVDYIITYSGHTPFRTTSGVCKMLNNLDKEEKIEQMLINDPTLDPDEIEIEETLLTEEDCVRRQAQETDYFMKLLLEKLQEKELMNDTVIVVFSDHYLYTLEDQTILDRYKNTSNNLINNTPFFIWSNNIKKQNINSVTSQLNILPTLLNLFGIEYNPNHYIAEDALSKDYEGIAFFSDYSWYDGNVYVSGGEVTNGKEISPDELENKNSFISHITKKNDLALKYNYFKNISDRRESGFEINDTLENETETNETK